MIKKIDFNRLFNKNIFLPFLVIIFLIINIFFILFITTQLRNQEFYIALFTEKKINFLMESLRQENIDEFLKSETDIISFGLYNPDGSCIYNYNNAPESIFLKDERITEDYFEFKKDYIIVIRQVGPMMRDPDFFRRRMPFNDRHMMMNKISKIVYIKLKSQDFLFKRNAYYIFILFFEIFLASVFSIIIYLYKNNIKYKANIERQKELANIGEISRNLAHEIKNPLAAIKLQTGYLKKVLNNDYGSELAIIENETDRLKLLTEKIKDLLKDPVGSREEIKIVSFINEMLNSFENKITVKTENEDASIMFDRQRLRSILENVILNAVESQKEAGCNDPVEIEILNAKEYLEVNIKDRGAGLKDNDIDKLFDPFFTTKTKGSGIGLSMVKRFIEASEGKIIIESISSGGVKVKLKFKKGFNK